MFSKERANPIILLIPMILLVGIAVLIFLIVNIKKDSIITTSNQDPISEATNTDSNQSSNSKNQQTNSSTENTNNKVDVNKIVSSPPVGEYDSNKCPDYLVSESTGNSFAIDNDQKYSLSSTNKSWIQSNCSDTQTLTF